MRRSVFLFLLLAVASSALGAEGEIKTFRPGQLLDFSIRRQRHYPVTASAIAGNEVHHYLIQFDNSSKLEIASCDVRFRFDRDGQETFTSPVLRIDKFSDHYFQSRRSSVPGRLTFSNNPIDFDRPKAFWDGDPNIAVEIVSIRAFVGPQPLNDLSHFFTWLQRTPEPEIVRTIDARPELANLTNEDGYTSLVVAHEGSTPAVIAAIRRQFPPNTPGFPSGLTPMHCAVLNPNPAVLEYVRASGGEMNTVDANGRTPLMLAMFHSLDKYVVWLVRHGAAVDRLPNQRYSPLTYAIVYRTAPTVDLLIARGAHTLAPDKDGYCALHLTAMLPDIDVPTMRLLLARGTPVDHADPNFGVTALMAAARARRFPAARWLLRHGANIGAKDRQGRTAFDHAREGSGNNSDADFRREVVERKATADDPS